MLLPILRLALFALCVVLMVRYPWCFYVVSTARLCLCVFACWPACLFARPWVRLGCHLVSLCSVMLCPCFSFVWFLVLCCMLTTSNRTPPPCHLLAAVLESKGRFSSNGNRRSDAGRPYTLRPSLQTHISRTVNGARDRRAPWM